MMEFFRGFLATKQFIPHGHCYVWQPGLLWLHIMSDSLIALAYCSIPIMLVYLVYQRRDIPFNSMFLMFGALIIACGATHVMDIWTLWHPTYWLSGTLKAITAFVSVYTVVELVPLIPVALAFTCPVELKAANVALQKEISDRKQVEAELFKEKEFLKVLLENAEAGIAACDAEGILTLFNHACREYHGLPEQPLPPEQWGQHYNLYLPDGKTPMQKEDIPLFRAWCGESVSNVEMAIVPKHGKARTVTANGRAIYDAQGQKLGAVVILHDITERKQAELALRQSEEKNRLLNVELERRVNQRTAALMSSIQKLADEVAHRQQAQKSLQQSEEFLRRLITSSVDCIKVLDLQGNLLYMNAGGRSLLEIDDFSPLLYTQWLGFWQGTDKQAADCAIEQALAGGVGKFQGYCPTKKGKPKCWETVITPIMDTEGKPEKLLAISRDITERKQVEAQIKASLTEKEVLLKEIHHRVKNNLQIISSLLNLQSSSIDDSRILEILKACENRVFSMAIVHEKLYQSSNLAQLDFAAYLEDLASNLFTSYNINPDAIKLSINVEKLLIDVDTAIPIGLIITELVTNALKYAFPIGIAGEIKINFQAEEQLILSISDDGVGFPEDFDWRNTDSLGLQIVDALTNQLQASIELNQSNGTEFKIKIPLS